MINVTERAAEKIQSLMEGEEPEVLRVGVNPGGCSGFTYDMYFVDEATADDWQGTSNGIQIVTDIESYPYLDGATLDYKETLMGGGFQWQNPNANRGCGCGKSFS